MDANGDGYVIRAEIAAFIVRSMNGLPIPGIDAAHPLPPASNAIFTTADADHDGRLSSAEAVVAAEREFAATDANHDGLVSPAERMAYLGKELGRGTCPSALGRFPPDNRWLERSQQGLPRLDRDR